MKNLPNEGILSLSDIRHLEFSELLWGDAVDSQFGVYDTKKIKEESVPQRDFSFAFMKKETRVVA